MSSTAVVVLAAALAFVALARLWTTVAAVTPPHGFRVGDRVFLTDAAADRWRTRGARVPGRGRVVRQWHRLPDGRAGVEVQWDYCVSLTDPWDLVLAPGTRPEPPDSPVPAQPRPSPPPNARRGTQP